MLDVAAGTLVVYGDIACPWSHLCVHGLRTARTGLGLDDEVDFDLRSFPLELFNGRPTPKRTLDAEIPVVGALDPSAGWQMWQGPGPPEPGATPPPPPTRPAGQGQGGAGPAGGGGGRRGGVFPPRPPP